MTEDAIAQRARMKERRAMRYSQEPIGRAPVGAPTAIATIVLLSMMASSCVSASIDAISVGARIQGRISAAHGIK